MSNWIYIGETIPSMGLRRNMVVKGDIPLPQIQSLIDLKPMLRALYVHTSRCAEARNNLRIEGTLEYLAFQETIKIRQKERK